jgi:hypothetical protein
MGRLLLLYSETGYPVTTAPVIRASEILNALVPQDVLVLFAPFVDSFLELSH